MRRNIQANPGITSKIEKISENITHAQIENTGIAKEQIQAMPHSRAVSFGSFPGTIPEF